MNSFMLFSAIVLYNYIAAMWARVLGTMMTDLQKRNPYVDAETALLFCDHGLDF